MSDHLRRLLHLDLQALGWRGALAQLASQVCQAFAPGRVLLALRSAVRWEAVTAAGTWIDEQEIRTLASLSILAAVRDSGEPLLAAAGTPLGVRRQLSWPPGDNYLGRSEAGWCWLLMAA
ncbi:MAG: hypothetical protein IT479_13840 [Xanthomonadales bacterium]|nr:hypothetical protein [Xanthomonadales bacterium]MCC6594341.1 hypothetical protein [Xanthomonadales bacterium]MCE7930252.1 hypothetical protein [Xanthomonadales bacterium PRO6]